MSFNPSSKERVSLTVAGVTPESLSTSQEAVPVPYIAGTVAVSTRWIMDAYAPNMVEVSKKKSEATKGDSKALGSGSGRYNYFGSIAGLIGHGPLARLLWLNADDDRVWTGDVDLSTATNPYPLTVGGIGDFDIYRGTYDQGGWGLPAFSYLNTAQPHYKGFAGFHAKNILFGEGRESPPNFRWGVARQPVQTLVTGAAAQLDDGQVNPLVVIAELLTSPWCGLGMSDGLFNKTSWQTAADLMHEKRAVKYVSLLLNNRVQAKALAAELFELCNGYWRVDHTTGGCEVGIWPAPETINIGSLPLYTASALIDPPDLSPETWDDITARFVCSYTDRAVDYKTRSVKHSDPRASGGLGSEIVENIDMPYITRRTQALAYARECARRRALPGISGQLSVRPELMATVRPGQHIRLDIEPEPGGLQFQQVCRVLSISRPPEGPATVRIAAERTLVPVAYTPAETEPPQTVEEVPDIIDAQFFELPPQLADGDEFAIGVLASRPSDTVTSCAVYFDSVSDANSTFPLLGSHSSYALHGEIDVVASASAQTLTVHLLDVRNREIIASDPGSVAARNDEVLAIIIHSYDAGQAMVEICSIQSIAAVDTHIVALTVLRGRSGTAPLVHTLGASVWMIRRDALPWYRHADFRSRLLNGSVGYLKLQPATDQAARPFEDCVLRPFQFDSVRVYAPVITIDSPSDSVGIEVGQAIACSGSVSDIDGNLTTITVMRSQGGAETVVLDKYFAPCKTVSFSIANILFPVEGISSIVVRAQDSTLRTVEKRVSVVVGSPGSGGTIDPNKIKSPIMLEGRYVDASDPGWYEVPSAEDSFLVGIPEGSGIRYWNLTQPWFFKHAVRLLDGRTVPADGIYNYPPGEPTVLGVVKVSSQTIDGMTINSRVSNYDIDTGEFVSYSAFEYPAAPAIEFFVASSGINSNGPATDWVSLSVMFRISSRNGKTIYNVPGGYTIGELNAAYGLANYGGIAPLDGYTAPCVGLGYAAPGVRIWVKAVDLNGILLPSDVVYFDLYQ